MVSLRPHLARRLIRWGGPVLGAALVLLTTAPGGPPSEADRILDGWFASPTARSSWSAAFTQTRRLRTLRQPLTARGRLWYLPPDRFRWELGEPARTVAIRRGEDLWLMYPRLKRLEHYPLRGDPRAPWSSAVTLIEAGMPRDRTVFEQRFHVRSITASNGVYRIEFAPRSPSARQFLGRLSVELATNDFSLRASTLAFVDGSELRNDYTNTVLNPPLAPALFEVSTNADWQITEPAEAGVGKP